MVSMTRQHPYALAGLRAAAAALHAVTANDVSFANKRAFPIALYNLADQEPRVATTIASGAVWTNANVSGYNYYRHGDSAEATVASLRFDPQRGSSYDVSIIPPQALYCSSFEACRNEAQGKRGFNVPVQVVPEPVTAPSDRCKPVTCGADDPTRCSDGFLFPADSADKYKLCAADQSFQVVFCPEGTATISSVASGGGGGVGEVLPGNLRGTGSSGGQSFTNATGPSLSPRRVRRHQWCQRSPPPPRLRPSDLTPLLVTVPMVWPRLVPLSHLAPVRADRREA